MITDIRLNRFNSEDNCYKIETSPCPVLKECVSDIREYQRQIAELQEKLKASENRVSIMIQHESDLRDRCKDQIRRRNLQIKDLKQARQDRISDLQEVAENRQKEILQLQDKYIACLSMMTAEQKAKLTK